MYYKVTIVLNNDHRITNTVKYIWEDNLCDKLNSVRRDAFTAVAGIIVQPEDISYIIIEELGETVLYESKGDSNGVGADSGKRACGSDSNCPCDSNDGR